MPTFSQLNSLNIYEIRILTGLDFFKGKCNVTITVDSNG